MSSTTIQFGVTGAAYTTLPSLITFLESKGIGSVEATHLQNIVNYMLSLYAVYPSGTATKAVGTVYPDATMITAWEKFSKYIFDVAVGTFIGYSANGSLIATHPSDAEVETWISVNRTDISATVAAVLADIISIDLNPYLVISGANTPALDTGDPQVPDNPVLIYSKLVSSTLETITRYLRTVSGTIDATAIASISGMPLPTKDVSANSSSYGGTSVPILPDVVI